MEWSNRIVGEGQESPEQLLANPENYRRHPKEQIEALEGVLDEVGWVQRIIVNKATGHLIDGHARVELAMRAMNMFRASRKLAKGHQNMLVFAKGQPEAKPLEALADAIAAQFEDQRTMIDAYAKVLVFSKGDPKTAASEFGPVAVIDPEGNANG